MADTPKTPAPPRRKAATGPRKTTRTTPPKAKAPAAEGSPPANADVKAAVPRKAPTRKPAAAKAAGTATARAKTAAKSAAAKVSTTANRKAEKIADAASSARQSAAQSAPVQLVSDTRERMGDRNFFAAVVGGVAALGAAIGGVFYALRGGSPDRPKGDKPPTT